MVSDKNSTERRRFRRVPFKAKVTVTTPRHQWSVWVVDISLKGMLFEEPATWPDGTQDCDVELELGEQNLIRTAGRVVRRFGGLMGYEWSSIDLDSLVDLRRLLELNLGDHELVERDIASLFRAHSE